MSVTTLEVVTAIGLPLITGLIGVITAFIGSNGYWEHRKHKIDKKTSHDDLVLGLAHARLLALCNDYIKRGYISPEEYEDLIQYLYDPYVASGGNGTVKKLIEHEINHLPSHPKKRKDHDDVE